MTVEKGLCDEARARIINRFRRIEGQARGIQRMLAEHQDCREIIGQISALKAAVENAGKAFLIDYVEKCLEEELARGGDYRKTLREALSLLLTSRLS